MYWPKLKSVAREIIEIEVLVVLQTPNLLEEEAVGVGDGTVRKSVVDFLYIGPP